MKKIMSCRIAIIICCAAVLMLLGCAYASSGCQVYGTTGSGYDGGVIDGSSGTELADFPGPDIAKNKHDAAIIKYLYISNVGSVESYFKSDVDFWGSKRYKGTGECWGYAEKCRKLFGTGGKKKSLKMKVSAGKIKKVLRKLRPGTHIRGGYSKSGPGRHSFCFLALKGNTVYYTDTAFSNNPQIMNTMDVKTMAMNGYSHWLWYIQPTGRKYSKKVDLKAAALEENQTVELAWLPVKGAKRYDVYRSRKKNSGFKKIKTVKSAWYVDRKAPAGKVYYKVKVSGKKLSSKAVGVTKKLASPAGRYEYDINGYPTVTWDQVPGAKKYAIYKWENDRRKRIKTTTTREYKIKDLGQEKEKFEIVAVLKNGSKANSTGTSHRFARAILAPEVETVSGGSNEARFRARIFQDLSWVSGAEARIVLERSKEKDGSYAIVDDRILFENSSKKFTVPAEYELSDIENSTAGRKYYYRVGIRVYDKKGYLKTSGNTSRPVRK